MAINFNHTVVWSKDREASATSLTQILGLPAPKRDGVRSWWSSPTTALTSTS